MKLKNILITVKDVERAAAFYHDLFGLDVILRSEGKVILTEGLVLQDRGLWEQTTGKAAVAPNHAVELYFEEPDLDGFIRKLDEYEKTYKDDRGQEVGERVLKEHPWGQRILRFLDPDGTLLEVGTPIDQISYRCLGEEEICPEVFSHFIRHQVVTKCWRREEGQWVIRDAPFIDDWGEREYQVLTSCLKHTAASGGFVCGAFYRGMLKGFVSVEPELFGGEQRYLDLSSIHVSEDMRRSGIGAVLFRRAKKWAREKGAGKLYISAHSAIESQAFYQKMGCVEAQVYEPGHVEKEPFDCQLECSVSEENPLISGDTEGRKEYIKRRVHELYWNEDINCARTALICFSELFDTMIEPQTLQAAVGLHGAGGYRGQCGLVEGALMFIGIYLHTLGKTEEEIVSACYHFASAFEKNFGSLRCLELRPSGFSENDPPHMCENLTCNGIEFACRYILL